MKKHKGSTHQLLRDIQLPNQVMLPTQKFLIWSFLSNTISCPQEDCTWQVRDFATAVGKKHQKIQHTLTYTHQEIYSPIHRDIYLWSKSPHHQQHLWLKLWKYLIYYTQYDSLNQIQLILSVLSQTIKVHSYSEKQPMCLLLQSCTLEQ